MHRAVDEVLATETRLLEALIAILRRQRAATWRGDLTDVDAAVFATQRVLHTLAEAGRRRRAIYEALGVPGHAGAPVIAVTLGRALTPELDAALERLMRAAGQLASEVETNRAVLRAALTPAADAAVAPDEAEALGRAC